MKIWNSPSTIIEPIATPIIVSDLPFPAILSHIRRTTIASSLPSPRSFIPPPTAKLFEAIPIPANIGVDTYLMFCYSLKESRMAIVYINSAYE